MTFSVVNTTMVGAGMNVLLNVGHSKGAISERCLVVVVVCACLCSDK